MGQPTIGLLRAGLRAAEELRVKVAKVDESPIMQGIWRRTKHLQNMRDLLTTIDGMVEGDLDDQPPTGKDTSNNDNSDTTDTVTHAGINNNTVGSSGDQDRGANRRGNSGRPTKDPETVDTSNYYKGAEDWDKYRDVVFLEIRNARQLRFEDDQLSYRTAAEIAMKQLKANHGIDLSHAHIVAKLREADSLGDVVPPERPGGVFLPHAMEERIARLVKQLRNKKLPVFPEDVMGWAAALIKGTRFAGNFLKGKASEGWYRGFLRRHNLVTGTDRPLEMTRSEWLSDVNLSSYYETAAEILVNAGVAQPNTCYEPSNPMDEPIKIIHPERIFSFDETRLELDCTKGGKGKKDRGVFGKAADDHDVLVTMSSSTTTAVCGRTGDGKALPPYIVFNSGNTLSSGWTRDIKSDVLDSDGKPIKWRFGSNEKGSLNEEGCEDYLRNILYPAAAAFCKPKSEQPGQQAVIFCDGVGTHLGITVLEAALELGFEICLRVPHLSHIL